MGLLDADSSRQRMIEGLNILGENLLGCLQHKPMIFTRGFDLYLTLSHKPGFLHLNTLYAHVGNLEILLILCDHLIWRHLA